MNHRSHYMVTQSRPSLGALPFDFNVDDLVSRVVTNVGNRVTADVTRIVEVGVDRMTSSAGAGLDKFLDSPAGVALADKMQEKAEKIAVRVVKNNQVNLALLGVAGTAIVMGSVNVGSKMSPGATRLAFAIAGVAVALVASGVFSPVDPTQQPPLVKKPPPRRTI